MRASLVEGFREGFRIGFQGSLGESRVYPNLKSASQNPDLVSIKIQKEVSAGRIAGPFSTSPYEAYRVSPLGLVPKKTEGQFRLIHHLSFPEGASINDNIPQEQCSVSYASVDDAVQLVQQLGTGCFLAKTDIKSAFRIIPVHPADYHLLGMTWEGKLYFDHCLPMGCSSACRTFESFSSALEWAARHKLAAGQVVHILDDFLFIEKSAATCGLKLERFIGMCKDIGVPIAQEKTEGPSTCLKFAGIELDSVRGEARLPLDKVQDCIAKIRDLKGRRKVTLQELQSVIGSLNFACKVVVPGRAFLRRLIDQTRGLRKPHHRVKINRATRADLDLWYEFLLQFNGRLFFLPQNYISSQQLHLYTDASGSQGYGAILGKKWFFGAWPESVKGWNITILELYPIVAAVCIWVDIFRDKCICFHTDNMALVHVINKQTSKEPQVMKLIRKLVMMCLRHNVLFKADHVPGVYNGLADALSRLQIQKFRELAPEADKLSTHLPWDLLPQSLML